MIQRRKKLIEVALPLAAINKASAREKSIRHGHPSTLHLWWARRPLAACRAVLFSQLVDDPSSDPRYRIGDKVDEEGAGIKRAELFNLIEEMVKWENTNNPDVINRARAEIARCVASRKIELGELKKETVIFGSDEGSDHPEGAISHHGVTAYEMALMRCNAEVVNHFLVTYAPPILDPFAGGGSIPLEAQRLGLRAHASDLNPVPVLINKALIEIPPKFAGVPPVNPDWQGESEAKKSIHLWEGAQGLAEDVRYYGQWMREQAEQRIGHLYPKVKITQEMVKADREDLRPYLGQELTVIAWLWARTVASPDPSIGGKHVPLVRSFWLSKKKGKEAYVRPVVDRQKRTYEFNVRIGKPTDGFDPGKGTKPAGRGSNFECILSQATIDGKYIKTEGQAGRMKSRLIATVCEGRRERVYISHTQDMEAIADLKFSGWKPEFDLAGKSADQLPLYGMKQYWQLFTTRQLTALTTFSDLVKEAREQILVDAKDSGTLPPDDRPLTEGGTGLQSYADAVATYLGFALDKSANYWSAICGWHSGRDIIMSTFGRQALPMVWDFAEANPLSESTGNYISGVSSAAKSLLNSPPGSLSMVRQLDATADGAYSGEIVSTDPPYYDNICYADLSDFFYVWLRRTLKDVYPNLSLQRHLMIYTQYVVCRVVLGAQYVLPKRLSCIVELLSTMLTPKVEELIASPYRHDRNKQKAAAFFEDGLGSAIGQWRRHGHNDYPTTIFYAFNLKFPFQKSTNIL